MRKIKFLYNKLPIEGETFVMAMAAFAEYVYTTSPDFILMLYNDKIPIEVINQAAKRLGYND